MLNYEKVFMKVPIKLLTNTATIPTSGSAGAAGKDLYADLGGNNLMISPHKTATIPLGIAMAIPDGVVGQISMRSGTALKKGLMLVNGVGIIDSDYRGEWKLIIHNTTDTTQIIEHGERIAQVLFVEYEKAVFYPVKELEATDRGDNGFGSTGTH